MVYSLLLTSILAYGVSVLGQTYSIKDLGTLGGSFSQANAINATLYAVFAATARRVLASPRAQRRFNLAGGSLLTGAGIWALRAQRVA